MDILGTHYFAYLTTTPKLLFTTLFPEINSVIPLVYSFQIFFSEFTKINMHTYRHIVLFFGVYLQLALISQYALEKIYLNSYY